MVLCLSGVLLYSRLGLTRVQYSNTLVFESRMSPQTRGLRRTRVLLAFPTVSFLCLDQDMSLEHSNAEVSDGGYTFELLSIMGVLSR